jgi:methionine--tRNA ligase beta chain
MADETGTPDDTRTPPPPPLDLRVARVTEAREHPNADRLLVLRVDLGEEERQLVAGIVGHYAPEELPGKHIVVVANLAPAKLRGEESQGMLLAVEDGERLGLLLAPGASPGTPLRPGDAEAPGPEKIGIDDFSRHTIVAEGGRVTVDGSPLGGAELHVDRGVEGRLR